MARLFRCFLSITLVLIGSVAHATVQYTYTGKYFQWKPRLVIKQLGHPCPSGCKVAGYFVTQGPLSPNLNNAAVFPLSFSFTDGRQTINSPSSSPNTSFMVSTDSYGDSVAWHTTVVQATGATGFIDTCSTPGPYGPRGLELVRYYQGVSTSRSPTRFLTLMGTTTSLGLGSPRSVLMNPLFKRPKPAL
jgi:hypothetical protein